MNLDAGAKPNGSDPRAHMHLTTRHDATGDSATIHSLSTAVDRLTAIVERLVGREAAAVEQTRHVMPQLTPRELEVSLLIVEGLSTAQIAARLVVEPATIKTHRRSISRKCGTSSKVGLQAKRAEWDQT